MTSVDRIQGLSGSLAVKVPCRVATTANITLSGEQTIDGVAVVDGNRVLVKNQTTTTENGVYVASTGVWARALDFDGNNDVVTGTIIGITAGTVSAGFFFEVTTANPIVPGTSVLTFTASAPAAASAAAASASAAAAAISETNAAASEAAAQTAETNAETAETNAETAETNAAASAAAAAASAANLPNASTAGALKYARSNAGATGWDYRSYADVLADIGARGVADDVTLAAGKSVVFEGTTEDAFETTLSAGEPTADRVVTLPNATTTVAGLAVAETFTAPQRGTITTDNDGSFDQSVTNNFFCTPSGAAALTFTNHTAGQSGLILFVNGSNYAITAAATTYIAAADLAKLSATGTYVCSYISNGTNTYVVVSAALTSAGA